MTPSHNAITVVQSWRSEGSSLKEWGPAAQGVPPSKLNQDAADAFRQVSRAADKAADGLILTGFRPGHPLITGLRGVATVNANQSNRLSEWAHDLRLAEEHVENSQSCTCWRCKAQ